MTIKTDPAFAGLEVPTQGTFIGTYESDHGHASAQLFRKGTLLRALLSYPQGNEPGHVKDDYLSDLRRIAGERGLTLKLLHVA